MSTAVQLNPEQPELLKRAAVKMAAPNSEVILALDNDKAGRAMSEKLLQILSEIILCRTHFPAASETDWNDELRSNQR